MQSAIKRLLEMGLALAGLFLLIPLFALVVVLIKLDSPGPAFFTQERVGRNFRRFRIYKFRTMATDPVNNARLITVTGDTRVTRVGRSLRWLKIDELPQLWNVLKGDMSLVGPRPEVPRFVEQFHSDYEEILSVRPGITDLASLKYRDESSILAQYACPEEAYLRWILPDKLKLAKEYVQNASLALDLKVILRTLLALVR